MAGFIDKEIRSVAANDICQYFGLSYWRVTVFLALRVCVYFCFLGKPVVCCPVATQDEALETYQAEQCRSVFVNQTVSPSSRLTLLKVKKFASFFREQVEEPVNQKNPKALASGAGVSDRKERLPISAFPTVRFKFSL